MSQVDSDQKKASKRLDKKLNILAFIDEYIRMVGNSPTVRDISDCFHYSGTGGPDYQLDQLEKDGWIMTRKSESGYRQARTIHITPKGQDLLDKFRTASS